MGRKSAVQVLVACDGSETANHAIDRALRVAARAPEHVLHFVTVLDPQRGLELKPTRHVDYRYADEMQKLVTGEVGRRLAEIAPSSEVHFYVHSRIGSPSTELLAAAEELGVDLIFIGSHGRTGLRRLLLGSVSEQVVRSAKCPVMVVRAKSYDDVALETIVDAAPSLHESYVMPHRYSYTDARVQRRSHDWPLL